eukprot:scaffold27629_cov53-Attheya_sp.AAC.1
MRRVQQDGPRSHPCLMPGPLSTPPPPDTTITMTTMMVKSMKERKMRWRLWGPWRLRHPLREDIMFSPHPTNLMHHQILHNSTKFYKILQSSTKSFE